MLIIGCGDVGTRAARLLRAQGRPVLGVVRSTASAQALGREGIEARLADLDAPATLASLPTAGAEVLYLAAPPPEGDSDPRMAAVLRRCEAAPPARIVYISTTGVYGDHAGAPVDEDTPPRPGTSRARRRLDAETLLQAFSAKAGTPVIILRVGGIYGPGRLPLGRIEAGTPVVCPEEAPVTNRIHADDLAGVCVTALARGRAGAIYNVADGNPSSMTDFIFAVADAAGLPRPPCVPLAEADRHLSPAMMSFIRESRTVDCGRLFRELGVGLRYARIEDGIRASLSGE